MSRRGDASDDDILMDEMAAAPAPRRLTRLGRAQPAPSKARKEKTRKEVESDDSFDGEESEEQESEQESEEMSEEEESEEESDELVDSDDEEVVAPRKKTKAPAPAAKSKAKAAPKTAVVGSTASKKGAPASKSVKKVAPAASVAKSAKAAPTPAVAGAGAGPTHNNVLLDFAFVAPDEPNDMGEAAAAAPTTAAETPGAIDTPAPRAPLTVDAGGDDLTLDEVSKMVASTPRDPTRKAEAEAEAAAAAAAEESKAEVLQAVDIDAALDGAEAEAEAAEAEAVSELAEAEAEAEAAAAMAAAEEAEAEAGAAVAEAAEAGATPALLEVAVDQLPASSLHLLEQFAWSPAGSDAKGQLAAEAAERMREEAATAHAATAQPTAPAADDDDDDNDSNAMLIDDDDDDDEEEEEEEMEEEEAEAVEAAEATSGGARKRWDPKSRVLPRGWKLTKGSRPKDLIFVSPDGNTRLRSWVEVGRYLNGEETEATRKGHEGAPRAAREVRLTRGKAGVSEEVADLMDALHPDVAGAVGEGRASRRTSRAAGTVSYREGDDDDDDDEEEEAEAVESEAEEEEEESGDEEAESESEHVDRRQKGAALRARPAVTKTGATTKGAPTRRPRGASRVLKHSSDEDDDDDEEEAAEEEGLLETGHPWLGAQVRRFFAAGPSDGEIVSWLPASQGQPAFWHMVHDDQDEEDLEAHEVRAVMRAHEKHRTQPRTLAPNLTTDPSQTLTQVRAPPRP